VNEKFIGRLDFELFGEKAPKTVNNFLALASGDLDKKHFWYKNNIFHKIVPNRWIMGGDIVNQNGTGSITVYNDKQTMEAE
jgi:cyclophilin family peptidyl-prolyl cis-trans isomerase